MPSQSREGVRVSSDMPRNTQNARDLPTGLLEAIIPGFGLISRLLTDNLGFDISAFVQTGALIVAILSAVRYAWGTISSLWTQWFMCSITISSTDRLYEQVMHYMSAKVVRDTTRSLMAKAGKPGGEMNVDVLKTQNQNDLDANIPPTYLPAPGKHRFWHNGHLFILTVRSRNTNNMNNRFGNNSNNDNEELITISCHGRSTNPIRGLLLECKRVFADTKREVTTVRSPDGRSQMWRRTNTRLSRPMDSVYLDETIKQDLIQDVRDFLHPRASRFYARRGIPYQRGYLFYGEPGTGKTSLSLALAGVFGLELHVLSLSDPEMSDQKLSYLFASLPPRCIVLLEDIDAVGLYRPRAVEDEKPRPPRLQAQTQAQASTLENGVSKVDESTTTTTTNTTSSANKGMPFQPRGLRRTTHFPSISTSDSSGATTKGVTLSGALNAIDGVASQEGRILIMTTNDPEALDKALIRPGRVDLQVYFGYASRVHARSMFERMYTPDEDDTTGAFVGVVEREKGDEKGSAIGGDITNTATSVEEMSRVFVQGIPDGKLTPAELQGFLLARRNKPAKAIAEVQGWVEEVLAARLQERNILKMVDDLE